MFGRPKGRRESSSFSGHSQGFQRKEDKMKRTRKALCYFFIMSIVVSLLLCEYASGASSKQVKLRLTCGLPINHFLTGVMEMFKQDVESRTNGLVKVETYPGGELYKHSDVPNVIPSGAVEMAICHTGHLGGLHPVGGISGYYFLISSSEQWLKARDTVMPLMDKAYNRYKIKVLVPLYYGSAAFGSKKLLRLPTDAKGLKIRGPTRAHLDVIKAWGAVGVSLPEGEVYDAAGKGAIDAVCTGWSSHAARAHYEVLKYFSGPTTFSIWILIMNLDTWNALSKTNQEIIMSAAKKIESFSENAVAKEDKKYVEKLKGAGATVHFFTAEELSAWTKASKPAFDRWVEECAKAGFKTEVIQIMRVLGIEGY
jgi:TRAP-type C4-dicarboxylate transport system substrate-binding protein